jgi:RNase H-fold protein (predicted Holliday junction resolvase)
VSGRLVLGIDPGSEKAGFALVAEDGAACAQGIVPVAELPARLQGLPELVRVTAIALGAGTRTAQTRQALAPLGKPIVQIDEYETTRQARELYFQAHPPRGWRRLVPLGMQTPPCPVDDFAAIIIARRYLLKTSD